MLIRTWNIFQGHTDPPSGRPRLEEMIRLASRDEPDVLMLQEVPVWALRRLARWSGMESFGAPAVRTVIGPLARSESLGRAGSSLGPPNSRFGQLTRLLVVGQANATLVAPHLRVVDRRVAHLNPRSVRRRHGSARSLGRKDRLKWAKERRLCLSLVVGLSDGRRAVLSNLHTTAYPEAAAEVELERAVAASAALARPDDVYVIAGDFNLTAASSRVLRELTGNGGFSSPGPAVDHILVRGSSGGSLHTWPDEQRRVDGRVLSDHAPVDVRLT